MRSWDDGGGVVGRAVDTAISQVIMVVASCPGGFLCCCGEEQGVTIDGEVREMASYYSSGVWGVEVKADL